MKAVWIPEAPKYPGLYALADPTPEQNCTNNPHRALHLATREECERWCENHPHPVFRPVEHGFMERAELDQAAEGYCPG